MEHHCHAKNCATDVPPEMLMCYKHWRMVPKDIQKEVWNTYRPGQCDDKQPSEAWHRAADKAIKAVHEKEQRKEKRKETQQKLDKLAESFAAGYAAADKTKPLDPTEQLKLPEPT